MRYILYLPNPRTITCEDSVNVDNLMKRVRESGAVRVEEEWASFKIYEMPIQCKKYRVMLNETDTLKRIKKILKLVSNACITEEEKKSLSRLLCMNSGNGYSTDISDYIEKNENKSKQVIPLSDEEKEMAGYIAA